MSDRSGTSDKDLEMELFAVCYQEPECDYIPKSYGLEFCIVKLKNDRNIFERRRPTSTVDDSSRIDIPEAVYFQYDDDVLKEDEISDRAESEEKYPETHSRKYFFLPQEYIKEGKEAEVSELYTNLILSMKLEKTVTVVQVEPADYKAVFENDPNLIWSADKGYRILLKLYPVICMFSEKDQIHQFYAALAERNRDYFMNEDQGYPSDLADMIETAAKEDSFRYQHIEALSVVLLRLLKTSSYIPGEAQQPQRRAKECIENWIDNTFNSHYNKNHFNVPEVFEELQANLFHLHLTRLVYQNYCDDLLSTNFRATEPVYWNPSNFGWVICEVIEAKLSKKDTVRWDLEELFMADIFQQPCFRRFLKDEQLRENFGNFILYDHSSILKGKLKRNSSSDYMNNVPTMETLFRGNYEDLKWEMFWDKSTIGFYVQKLFGHAYKGISVMDTTNITTAVLAMYPEEKGERRKDTANNLLKYMDKYFVLGRLRKKCIISEEKETDNFKEMQEILATCFRLHRKPSFYDYCEPSLMPMSDVSSELPLDRIYELYCQSKKEGKEVNPSAGLLWLGIAHRQAVGSLGDLSEEQQVNCLEMLASALDDLPLQTIETFFSSIQGFTARKTIPEDKTPQNGDNIPAELEKALEQKRAEIEKRITDYIVRRKKEETAVLFLLHSEIGIEVVKVNANMARYEKGHTTSAGIFIFITLFEYTDKILECILRRYKKTFDYYVLTFTKYLIKNSEVKDIFNKKSQLRQAVRKHIKSCLKHLDKYGQLNDLLTLDWQTYYNKWVAEKPVIGKFDLNLIRDRKQIGDGGYGTAYICHYSEFVFPMVYKQFSDTSAFHSIVHELNSLMKVQSHPHALRIFGVVTDKLDKAKGLMMEYCEGGSLDKLFQKSDYMYDGKKTVHWMAQAASALIFFRKIGVFHLDIKPANMLLCKDHHYLKIADMGITLLAEIQDNIELEPSISQNDKFVLTRKHGTRGFMAPEVEGSDKEKMVCSYASDIFSLGRTLWNIYHKEHPWDHIVNLKVIMPVFLNPIFDAEDIPEDQTPQAVENITADMETTLEHGMSDDVKSKSPEFKKKHFVKFLFITYAQESEPDDVKLECPKEIAKWIIRMTRFDPDARPTAVILHEEFKKQYEEYERIEKDYKRIEKEEALKETRATLQIIPSTKITFLHPIEDNQSIGIKLKNTSNAEILQWSASSSNDNITVVPAEGEIPPSEIVKVTLTYGEKSVVDANMGNFIVNYRTERNIDESEKEWLGASKQLKIVCNLCLENCQ